MSDEVIIININSLLLFLKIIFRFISTPLKLLDKRTHAPKYKLNSVDLLKIS